MNLIWKTKQNKTKHKICLLSNATTFEKDILDFVCYKCQCLQLCNSWPRNEIILSIMLLTMTHIICIIHALEVEADFSSKSSAQYIKSSTWKPTKIINRELWLTFKTLETCFKHERFISCICSLLSADACHGCKSLHEFGPARKQFLEGMKRSS